ncbi:MAG: Slam-dependent surface lipoprotein [Eikenella corrodens]|uniref:Slam-dependent surface lipoprotein n=1 Tax=Eikenella corrodens TaxID=539 RepID=UPI0006660B42|nr:Slam-dependent surface lipoprotein [Eikenella corrodens]MDU1346590.1 Slam-dependent surface lipoprotein [Eikenella corrodens]MDU4299398.1 Slam-dependent surface lipoprotein [Eikenella corrodens]
MSIRNKTLLAVLLCGVFGVAAAAPDGKYGSSSNLQNVEAGLSEPLPFGAGKAGLRFISDGHWSTSINLEKGPVQHIRAKYNDRNQTPIPINGTDPYASVNGTRNPQYLTLRDVAPVIGWFYNPKLGQVWYENRHNNTEVYSVRQMANPAIPAAPKFGGLVIAKVPGMGGSNGNVFFGEWAPRKGNPPQNSTDLNMADGKRTVWFVGDNPTGNTTGVRTATYNVLGINKHTPGQNDFYTGQVTATFGSGITGTMAGRISRSSDHVDFDHAKIDNRNGTFADPSQGMTGRFYGNQAAAMAGYTTRGTGNVGDDVAFGGSATDIGTRK